MSTVVILLLDVTLPPKLPLFIENPFEGLLSPLRVNLSLSLNPASLIPNISCSLYDADQLGPTLNVLESTPYIIIL
jgi:hypothetical protein